MAPILALYAILSALLAPVLGQGAPRKITLGCTTSSFSIPSWLVQDFQKRAGGVSFHLMNRATNQSSELACPTANGSWSSCSAKQSGNSALQASVMLNEKEAQFRVNQTWTCNDRDPTKPITFMANGNSSIALDCSGDVCKSVVAPMLIKGSLVTPVAITPTYASGPIGHDAPGCAAAAKSPSWVLENMAYLYQIGNNGASQLDSQQIILQILNPALGYVAACVGFLPEPPSLEAGRFTCNGQGFDFIGRDRYRIATTAMFEPKSFTFGINQTWYCDDSHPENPTIVVATGLQKLDLNCTTIEDSGTVTKECKAPAITLNGTLLSQEKLTPYSIEDPLPVPDGCTVSSIVAPSWRFSGFEVDRDTTTRAEDVSFTLKLETNDNEFPYPINVIQQKPPPPDMEGMHHGGGHSAGAPAGAWHDCVFGEGQVPAAPYKCSFMYDEAKNSLALNAEWMCNDIDADNPVIFSGMATTELKPLECSTSRGLQQCLTEESYAWSQPISNVTWRTTNKTEARLYALGKFVGGS